MLVLIVIACCVVPIIVAGLAVLVGKSNDVVLPFIVAGLARHVSKSNNSEIEHPGAPPPGTADRAGSRRRGAHWGR